MLSLYDEQLRCFRLMRPFWLASAADSCTFLVAGLIPKSRKRKQKVWHPPKVCLLEHCLVLDQVERSAHSPH